MYLRGFRPGDEVSLRAVFHSAVHTVASRDYSPEQIEAWAPAEVNWEDWGAKMRALRPFVVESAGTIVGYADLQPDGLIDHFFVSGDCQRQGVGRMLMERILVRARELGIPALTSNVSRTAQPFFLHFGFRIVEQRSSVSRGVVVPNAVMRKDMG